MGVEMFFKKGTYQNERQAWDDLRGPSNRNKRRRNHRRFMKLFPEGHNTSIKPLVQALETSDAQEKWLQEPRFQSLRKIHLDAFSMLATYGMDYVPQWWRTPPPEKIGEPEPRQCFVNAWELMQRSNIDNVDPIVYYVEGIVVGPLVLPMLHAWNTFDASSTAVDWSHYAGSQWTRYFGVALSQQEYESLAEVFFNNKLGVVSIFGKGFFPTIRDTLEELLQNRSN